jgi:hypothetical protein
VALAKIKNGNTSQRCQQEGAIAYLITMEALEIKREVEKLSQRLGKTQDYL